MLAKNKNVASVCAPHDSFIFVMYVIFLLQIGCLKSLFELSLGKVQVVITNVRNSDYKHAHATLGSVNHVRRYVVRGKLKTV